MSNSDIWKILDIDPTGDENDIKDAYRRQVVKVNPEDDPEGFKKLREAYDAALQEAMNPQESSEEESDEEKSEAELHIAKARDIYMDINSRIDEELWKEWLSAPVVTELDTTDEVRELFLAFSMYHFEYPNNIWKLFNNVFNFVEEKQSLAEVFPIDYLNFLEFRTNQEGVLDYYTLAKRDEIAEKIDALGLDINVTGVPDKYNPDQYESEYDLYIKEYSFLPSYIDKICGSVYSEEIEEEAVPEEEINEQIDTFKSLIEYNQDSLIISPLELAAKMRVFFFEGDFELTLKLAEAVLQNKIFENAGVYTYFTALFLKLRINDLQGTVDEAFLDEINAKKEEIFKDNPQSSRCILVDAYICKCRHRYDTASELFIDVLDMNNHEPETIMLLKETSHSAILAYQEKRETGDITEKELLEMAWAYFRTEQTQETFDLLQTFEPTEDVAYGYNNLMGRCYYNLKQYEEALPYLTRWIGMLNELYERSERGEELTKREKSRLTRRSFSYFMYASCCEELKRIDDTKKYYQKAIDLIKNENDINELFYYQECYGKFLMSIEDYVGAMEIWNEMIDRESHCIPAYVQRQKTAYEMRDAQLVIDDYYNIVRDVPLYAEAYVLAAKVFDIYNQKKDTESVFKHADEAGVVSDRLSSLKARIAAREGNEEEAFEIYKSIEKNIESKESDIIDEADIVDYYGDMASLLMNSKNEKGERIRLTEAEAYVRKGRAIDRDNKRLYWIMTDIAEWTNKEPEKVYQRMLKLFPEDAYIDFEFAEYYRRSGDMKLAEQYYLSCLGKDRGHKSANNKLMNLYQDRYSKLENRADYDEAVYYATEQLKLDDDDFYYVERALLYLDGYEFQLALEDAEKALEKNPDNVYACNAKGLALLNMKKYEEAALSFEEGINKMEEGETVSPFINLAKCYECLGEFEKAAYWVEQCREHFEDTSSILENLARQYTKAGKFDKAREANLLNEKGFRRRKKETGNPWFDIRMLKLKFKRIELEILSGNKAEEKRLIENDLNEFLRNEGYFAVETYIKPKGKQRELVALVFRDLADFYYYSERDFKKAISYYEQCIRYWDREPDTKKKGIIGTVGSRRTLPKPEDKMQKPDDLDDLARMYMCYAAACFMNGNKKKSEEFSKRSIECIIKGYGSIENYLGFAPVKPERMRIVAISLYLHGEKKKAVEMIENMMQTPRCSYCVHGVCYEKYLMMARIYEMEGDREKAIENYKIAFEYSPDDAEVFMALKDLEKK